jgi:Sec7-like guanine-nucleotide exchange factor
MNSSTQQVKKDIPLYERLKQLKGEIAAINPKDYIEAKREIVSRFRQNYNNAIFCYDQWDKYRDYSSLIHASMAIGKLMDSNEMMAFVSDHRSEEMKRLCDTVTHLAVECWENIRAATGRIVPFE